MPPAGATFHEEIKSSPRYQQQTSSYISLTRICHMATPSYTGSLQSQHLAERISRLSKFGVFVQHEKMVKYSPRQLCISEKPSTVMLSDQNSPSLTNTTMP